MDTDSAEFWEQQAVIDIVEAYLDVTLNSPHGLVGRFTSSIYDIDDRFDSYPSPWNISIPFDWHYPAQTTMIRLTSCCFHCAVTLQQQALKRSLISIPVLKPLGRYLTPGKSNHALNHSFCMIPCRHFIPQGMCGKTNHTLFFQFSPFRMPLTLTMLHSFH